MVSNIPSSTLPLYLLNLTSVTLVSFVAQYLFRLFGSSFKYCLEILLICFAYVDISLLDLPNLLIYF